MGMKRLWTAVAVLLVGGALAAADKYVVDAVHTSVSFKVGHVGISYIHGRFNEMSGEFTLDKANPAGSSFTMSIRADTVDTNNKKRDEHLRSPDFFNVKQFPMITFKSTSVKPAGDGYEVTGDFTLHGVTKPITLTLKGGKEVEFPKGVTRTGFSTELTVKRTDFGMDKLVGPAGDEVHIAVSFEGTRK
jgi:polyisoprenoid-binding protein YceI